VTSVSVRPQAPIASSSAKAANCAREIKGMACPHRLRAPH
jgi:hypothetical protein